MARIARLEISKSVKLAVFKRAGGPDAVQCEGCGLMLGGKLFAYDHQIPEWMRNAPRSDRTITAADVKLLGQNCCHAPKTAAEAGQRAHGNRIIEKAARAKPLCRPMAGSRNSKFKRLMNGTVEERS